MKNWVKMGLVIVCAIFCMWCEANAAPKTDKQIIKEYIQQVYGSRYRVRINNAEDVPDRVLEHRAGKPIVYVDRYVTKSDGKGGGRVIVDGPFKGDYIKYAKREKKGKKVMVYLIYSPYSNSTDDIAAIVSGKKIR